MARGGVKLSIYSTFDDKGAKQAERAMTAFTKKFGVLSGEGKNANLVLGDTTRKLAEASIKFEQAGAKMQATGRNLSAVGGTITKGLTLPILAIGGAALTASVDFESAFAEVNKSVDATKGQLGDLRDDIIETSKRMPVSADAIAGVYAMGGQLGITQDQLGAFSETVMGLEIATNMTMEEGGTQIAKFSNIMGTMAREGVDGFGKLGSTLVALGNNGASTEADIMAMAMRIAGAGANIGMSEANVLALSNALSSMGIEAEAGGSAISKTMSEIDTAVATNSESLSVWAETAGMSADDFAAAWKTDPVTALQGVFKGMGEVKDEGGNLNVLLEELGITELRQSDMLKRVSGAADLLGDSVSVANGEWETNSALTEEVTKRNETAAAKFTILKNEVKAAAIEMGDKLAPAALNVAGKLSNLVRKFSELGPKQMESIIKWGLIIAAIGPVIKIFGAVVGAIGGVATALGGMASTGAAIIGAFGISASAGFGTVGAAISGAFGGPVGLAIAALGLFAGAVYFATTKASDLEKAVEGVKTATEGYKAALDLLAGGELAKRQADLNLEKSNIDLTTAQEAYNKTMETAASGSPEAVAAAQALEQAQINQKTAVLDVARATGELTKAERNAKDERAKTVDQLVTVQGEHLKTTDAYKDYINEVKRSPEYLATPYAQQHEFTVAAGQDWVDLKTGPYEAYIAAVVASPGYISAPIETQKLLIADLNNAWLTTKDGSLADYVAAVVASPAYLALPIEQQEVMLADLKRAWEDSKGAANGYNTTVTTPGFGVSTFGAEGVGTLRTAWQQAIDKANEYRTLASTASSWKSGSSWQPFPTAFAAGGFSHGPETILWGEAGPEVIIPLDGSRNAMSLFAETARRLGVTMSAPSMSVAPSMNVVATSGGNRNVTINQVFNQPVRTYSEQRRAARDAAEAIVNGI